MPDAYPSNPKQAATSDAQQRYEELVEMLEGKFNTKEKWQLEAKSQLACALLHEAATKNPKLPGLIDKPELKDDFINSLAAIEAAMSTMPTRYHESSRRRFSRSSSMVTHLTRSGRN